MLNVHLQAAAAEDFISYGGYVRESYHNVQSSPHV